MRLVQRVPILVLSFLFAAVVESGHAHQYDQQSMPLNQLYPGPLGNADFGKIISGEFTGDLKGDVVVMDGDQPKLCVTPETFDSAIRVGGPANDICAQSGVVPNQDVILTVGSGGLVRYRRDSFAGTWEIDPLRDETTNWLDAQMVAVGDLDGLEALDIVGIAANGRDVLIEYGNLDGSYTPGTGFQPYATVVKDLWLLNWRETGDTPGTVEIALNSALGVEVHEANGVYLKGWSWTAAPILGAVVKDAGTPVERLALVTTAAGVERLFTWGDTQTDGWNSLGTPGVVALAAADADHDGDSDLFLSLNTVNAFWRIDNRSPVVPTFAAATKIVYGFGPQGRHPADNHAGIALRDCDSDGELDAVAPAQGHQGSPLNTVHGSLAFVNVGSSQVADWRTDVSFVGYVPATNELELHFTRPTTVLQAPAGATTKLGVKVFFTEALGMGTSTDPFDVGFAAVPASAGAHSTYRFTLPEGFSLETSHSVFSLIVRQTVVADSDQHVIDITPAMTGIFTADPTTPIVQQTPQTLHMVGVVIIPSSTPTFGGLDIGPTVPSMDPEDEPQDHDFTPQ